jgi:hypothetical protein
MKYANFWTRCICAWIDGIFVGLITRLVTMITVDKEHYYNDSQTFYLWFFGVFFIYFLLTEHSGGSYGKKILKIETIDKYSRENISMVNSFKKASVMFLPFVALVLFNKYIYLPVINPDNIIFLNLIRIPLAAIVFMVFLCPLESLFRKDKSTLFDRVSESYLVEK